MREVFAQQALEYLVDMFNDEIEEVRIEVYRSLIAGYAERVADRRRCGSD